MVGGGGRWWEISHLLALLRIEIARLQLLVEGIEADAVDHLKHHTEITRRSHGDHTEITRRVAA